MCPSGRSYLSVPRLGRLTESPLAPFSRGLYTVGNRVTRVKGVLSERGAFPVFKGETVPVERVRPDKDVVRDEETVSEEVRKEHIDTNGIDDDRR